MGSEPNIDELVKSLILLDVAYKRLFTKPSTLRLTCRHRAARNFVRVDDWSVGDGKPGPISSKLKETYGDLVAA
jgi:hypothetical protein